MSEEKIVVPSDEKKVSKKVAVELEVDTSDDGPSTVAGTTINIELGAETIGDFIDMVVADGKIYINGILDNSTNSSLSSYGDQGVGIEFRLGYYRSNYSGLNGIGSLAAPLYSVMAISNNTQVYLNGSSLITLNAGQSYCFQTNIGALLTSDKSVVVNSGNWGDAPGGCTDGVFTQVLPTRIAGTNYIIVRGKGTPGASTNLPEQSTIIATQNNTTVNVVNYNNLGKFYLIP